MTIRLLIILFLLSGQVFAHKLSVMATAEDGTVTVNAFFPDGKVCSGCDIKVEDVFGKEITKGKIEKDGSFFYQGNLPDELVITVDAGLGHMSQVRIKSNDSEDLNTFAEPTEPEDFRKIIRQEMAKQTTELKAEINKGKSRFDMIVAGVGYILGIFGIITLLRKK